jgi:hypothetical protein
MEQLTRWALETERRITAQDGRLDRVSDTLSETQDRVTSLEDQQGWLAMAQPSAIREWGRALAPWGMLALVVTGNLTWEQLAALLPKLL